jgi:hypothetical protein
MKTLAALIAVSFFAPGFAEANRKPKVFLDEKMSEMGCERAISEFVLERKLTREPVTPGKPVYLFVDMYEKDVGGSNYREGKCYIYLD